MTNKYINEKVQNMNVSNNSKKGFIFSIDAFIAFLIAMSMIYSIIFLSSVVTSKNDVILQMHTIADDVVVATLSTKSTGSGTELDALASEGAESYLDGVVPAQYNYNVEVYNSNNGAWESKGHRGNEKIVFGKVVVYAYSVEKQGGESTIIKDHKNPYKYLSCKGTGSSVSNGLPCSAPGFYKMYDTVKPVQIKISIWE